MIMRPKSKEQLVAIKAIARVLKVDFETEEASPYKSEFVESL